MNNDWTETSNLLGTEWVTEDGHYVRIDAKLGTMWVGRLSICQRQITTIWWPNLDHFNEKDFNLVRRKISDEDREFHELIVEDEANEIRRLKEKMNGCE